MVTSKGWTPDQQRTTPRVRRAVQHPGNIAVLLPENSEQAAGLLRRWLRRGLLLSLLLRRRRTWHRLFGRGALLNRGRRRRLRNIRRRCAHDRRVGDFAVRQPD